MNGRPLPNDQITKNNKSPSTEIMTATTLITAQCPEVIKTIFRSVATCHLVTAPQKFTIDFMCSFEKQYDDFATDYFA